MAGTNRILIIVTNVGEYDTVGMRTGLWLGELTHFYDVLEDTKKVSNVRVEDYDVIYLTGGHGVMFDFRRRDLAELVARFYDTGRIVSAVCHGPAGLIEVQLGNGERLVQDRDITGFSWPEEEAAQRDKAVPYSLQDELKRRGGKYSMAEKPFDTYVREDGRLVTGQNPGSAKAVADAVLKQLS